MTTKLSSKGQVVLPKQVRSRLRLRPGVTLTCKVQGDSIVLTPEHPIADRPRLITDPKTGLSITQSPDQTKVTSAEVRAAMSEFP